VTGPRTGPTNTLTDVGGLRVGHHGRTDDGWLTGTTVIVAPEAGAVASVDVRGGGPGTRETDALDPRNLVERVHAVVLTGGSAFGLAAADGVMRRLADAGIGFPVGTGRSEVVPIVPAAVLYDLGRGGRFRATPDARFGAAAYESATDGPVAQGNVGAGTGAVTGASTGLRLKGGIGSASTILPDGTTVAALVAVNAIGSTIDPVSGELYGARFGIEDEFAHLAGPDPAELAGAWDIAEQGPFNTTIGVIATDATLTKAQCQKVAGVAHDGMARAIRPVHSMFDGDTVFALATCRGAAPAAEAFNAVLAAGADALSRAIVHGMLAATGVGAYRAYAEAFPSAVLA
jgi:putative pantetheine hydrolase